MARMTTRSNKVKQEHSDDTDTATLAATSPQPQPTSSHPISIRSTPMAEQQPPQQMHSSGDTTIADDVEMHGINGASGIDGFGDFDGYSGQQNGSNGMNGVDGASHEGADSAECAPDALHTLGSESRALIKVIQKLAALGIDATLPSLPKFVVVGDQSMGKSSIIEAICDIKLPRGTGTVTRCPYQITTSAAKDGSILWSCTITLHRQYSYSPTHKAGRDPKKFDRWAKEDSLNPYEFATINDKNLLEEMLRRAQLAILNPGMHPAEFQGGRPVSQQTQVGFSPNVISLKIVGPELPELSFFDLPGAINVAQDASEQHMVPFIEKLIRNYLSDERALVLLACAADQDVENSTAFRFVKTSGAVDRCMGVLTKPDLLGRVKFPLIRRIINGEIFKLGNGWFITKQLSQEELDTENVTHAQARQREEEFFADEPWSTLFASLDQRLGIVNLQESISQKLTSHIVEALPEILGRVEERLSQVSAALAEFPKRPQSAAHTVMDESQAVAQTIEEHVKCNALNNVFRHKHKGLLRELKLQLAQLRPHVALSTPGYIKPAIEIGDDSDKDGAVTPTPSRGYTPAQTPSKMRKGNNGQAIRTPVFGGRETVETPHSHVKAEHSSADVAAPTKTTFTLDKIKQALDRGSSSGLPDQIDPKVIDHLVTQSQAGWRTLATGLITKVQELVGAMCSESIDSTLATRIQTQLHSQTTIIIDRFITGLLNDVSDKIVYLVDCETQRPITYATDHIKQLTEAARNDLKRKRLIERVDEYYELQDSRGVKVPQSRQDRMKKVDEVEAKIGADKYAQAVNAMATPLAYYDLASARLLDNVATHLEFGLLRAIGLNMRGTLRTGLKVTDEEYCKQLLAEDPQREALRVRLLGEKERLSVALEELRGLPHRSVF